MIRVASLCLLTLCLGQSVWAEDVPRKIAEEMAALDQRLKLATKRLSVAQKEKEVSGVQAAIAADMKAIALARQDIAAAELASRKFPEIIANTARIYKVNEPQSFCDATDFLRWKCHAKSDCDFDVTAAVCLLAIPDTEPKLFSAQYSCATQQREIKVPFGAMAYLTCK